jgi:nitrogen fixation NifU-like protein
MTEALYGKTESEARELFQRFRRLLTGGEVVDEEALGKLAALSGVREYPMRVKCATLAWHTLQAALDKTDAAVTTE